MKIEVIASPNMSTTDKGNLLENLSKEILENQSYSVTQQLRLTATEIDLLCEHNVNRKRIYVECKAHREGIKAKVLTQLLGTIDLKEYQEG